jgi:NAD(P)-dependent dehydrogenase (short-subunit alcohol dehydrogenase family)
LPYDALLKSFLEIRSSPKTADTVEQEPKLCALVTGAGSGIGEACTRRLSTMGWRVFAGVLDESQRTYLEQARLPNVMPILLDITQADSIAGASKTIADAVGPRGLSGLVNNAGIGVLGPVEYVPIERLRRQLEVNFIGHVAVTQAFLPLLREKMPGQEAGRIVNIASIAGRLTLPLFMPYAASKHGIEALSDALRLELRPWKMHVACIEPGLIATPIIASSQAAADAALAAMPPEGRERYGFLFELMKNDTRLRAAAQPPDVVARAVAHALTARRPKTRYVVGGMCWRFLLLSKLPDRLRDWVIEKSFG